MKRPAISIVLIVHNTAPWLPACLNSIAAQSFDDYEIVVVDVASNLATKGVLARRWRSLRRARPLILLRNVGGATAGNLGIARAKGRYVFLMDSDDLLPQHALRELYRAAERDRLDIAIGRGLSYIDNKPRPLRYSADRITWARPLVTESLAAHPELTMAPYYWGRLYRRDFLLRNRIEMRPGQLFADRYFTSKALKLSRRTGVVAQDAYYWRRDRAATADAQSITQRAASLASVRDRLASFADTETLFDPVREGGILAYVRAANLMRLFIHAKSIVGAGGGEAARRCREFVELARPFAQTFTTDEILAAEFLLARHRVQWYLLAQNRPDDLIAFLNSHADAERLTEGGVVRHAYWSILPDLPRELCVEARRSIGPVVAERGQRNGSPVLTVSAEIPEGMAVELLGVVAWPNRPRRSVRPRSQAVGPDQLIVESPDELGLDEHPPLALEYLAAGRVCSAPITVAEP
ncbi:MAG: glycosyltransferase family 2 protein [Propionicimonas sp.]